MTDAAHSQGFPPKHEQRKKDRWARQEGQRTVRGESSAWEQLSTYLGKSCRRVPSLRAFFPGSLIPIKVFRAWIFLSFFFSPVLAVLACISMPSCQNSLKETAAGELRNVSQTPGLVWGLEDSYRKLKRFLGQCLLWVFPLLPLTFSIFNFFFFFHFYLRHWLLQWPASVFLMVPFRVRLWPFSQPSLTSWVIF